MSQDAQTTQADTPSEKLVEIKFNVRESELLACVCSRCKATEARAPQQVTQIDGEWRVTAYGPPPAGWTSFSRGHLCPACTIEVDRFLAAPLAHAEAFLRGLVDAAWKKER